MKFLAAFVDILIRFRVWFLLACAVLVAVSFVPSTGLQFERTIENLFRKDDPRYENYLLDKRLFGGVETAIIAYDDPDLFSEEGLARLEDIHRSLSRLKGVGKISSLNSLRRPANLLSGTSLLEQVREKKVSLDELKAEILGTDLYRDRFVTADGKTALVLVELLQVQDDPQARADTIRQLQQFAAGRSQRTVVMGGPILVEEIFATLESDGVLLGIASSLILSVVIAILFRSIRWTLLPLLVVHVSLIWTKAILATSGLKLSMVSAQLVAMITVIGVATSVHVMIRYREERTRYDEVEALRKTLVHIVPAVFWTCLTTAAGFAALLVSSVAPFQSFAIMMSLGSILVFVAILFLVPASALMFRTYGSQLGRLPAEQSMTGVLATTVSVLRRYPWQVVIVLTLLLIFCSAGASRLSVATDFTSNFRSDSRIVQSYRFLKQRLPAVDTLDVLVEMPVENREFDQAIETLRTLQEELEADPRVVDTVCFVDLLDFIHEAQREHSLGQGYGWQRLLPSFEKISGQVQVRLLLSLEPRMVSGFLNPEENMARVMVQVKPVSGSEGKAELIADIESVSKQHFESSEVAGFYVLLANVVRSLLGDQWTTFALSVAAIFLLMSIALRSISLGFVAMVPNAAPIFIVLGTMGWLGLELNMATAMMASVSMGLSVDFSIHYLFRFRQELLSGREFFEALTAAHRSVGIAMLVANLALIAGFLSLTLSALIPSVHFGLMVSVTMIGGLVGNLVVLPLLLRALWQLGLIGKGKSADAIRA